MRIACIMMQKNERSLLGPWLTYHADLFGIENIYVFDNGSDDRETLATLTRFEELGLNLERGLPDSRYFNAKGELVANCIKWLDEHHGYDFYFPLDCDEFIAAYDEARRDFSVERPMIEKALHPFLGDPRLLSISFALDNIARNRNCYRLSTLQRKVFFASGTCESLDLGFHFGSARHSTEVVRTSIAYFHFHHRGYWEQKYRSMTKLSGRIPDFTRASLLRHKAEKGPGFHLIDWLLMSERDYDKLQSQPGDVRFPAFLDRLDHLATSIRQEDDRYRELVARLLEQGAPDDEPLSSASESIAAGSLDWCAETHGGGGMKGHLDSACIRQAHLVLEGWTSDRYGRPAVQIVVMADREIVPLHTFKRVDRPDVTDVFPDIAPGCGFRLSVALKDIPDATRKVWLVSHDPRDRASFIVKGASDEAVNWPELQAGGPIQWPLPEKIECGPRPIFERLRPEAYILNQDKATGINRRHYLELIRHGVAHFLNHQDAQGAIIDTYRRREVQYSTPCFAYAAALVAREDGGPQSLIDAAARAMDWACEAVSGRMAADAHEDFFPSPIAHAFPLLAPHVTAERRESWRNLLCGFDPFMTYRHQIGGSGGPGSNWNCLALAGEYLLYRQGLRGTRNFFEESIRKQGRLFDNAFGLYGEGPMVYDMLARAWLGDMLAVGFDSAVSERLADRLDRGALTSLLVQAPNGEPPSGGRSGQHIWADSLQCVIFEQAAARALMQADAQMAGMYKRAAHKALHAVSHWQGPSGAFQVVKNRADPGLRHGFEPYSNYSQYNLLTLTALGYAYEQSATTQAVPEQASPPEFANYVVELPLPFCKVVACCDATQVIVALGREADQTPAGLLRINFGDRVPQIGPGDGFLAAPGYELPDGNRANLSIGLAWKSAASWRSIADLSGRSGNLAESCNDDRQTRVKVRYQTGDAAVPCVWENYTLSRNRVQVDYVLEGKPDAVAVRVPLLISDGQTEYRVDATGDAVALNDGVRTVTYTVKGARLGLTGAIYPHRNGFAQIAEFEVQPASKIQLTIDCRDVVT